MPGDVVIMAMFPTGRQERQADRIVDVITSGYPLTQGQLREWCAALFRLNPSLKSEVWEQLSKCIDHEFYKSLQCLYGEVESTETARMQWQRDHYDPGDGV